MWDGGVEDPATGGVEEKIVDFGRPTPGPACGPDDGPGDALAKGLLRRDIEPLALNDIVSCEHPGQHCYMSVLDVGTNRIAASSWRQLKVNREELPRPGNAVPWNDNPVELQNREKKYNIKEVNTPRLRAG